MQGNFGVFPFLRSWKLTCLNFSPPVWVQLYSKFWLLALFYISLKRLDRILFKPYHIIFMMCMSSWYVSTVAIFANTRFHTKLHVKNSLLSLCILSLPLKANLIKTTAFMAFLGESINILNHRPQKIEQKSCSQNRSFEPKGPETLKSSLGLAGNQRI